MGRPKKSRTRKQEWVISLRLTEADYGLIFQAADVAGLPAATFARLAAVQSARKAMEEADRS